MKWLGKIIIGSKIQTAYFIFNLIPGGQDQNRGIGIVFTELAENLQTVRAGKIQIQQDQVVLLRQQSVQRGIAVIAGVYFVAVLLQAFGQRVAQRPLVLHNQNPHAAPPALRN